MLVLRNIFLVSCVLLACSALFPVLWHLWIYAGSANSNFYYAITLLFSVAQVPVRRSVCLSPRLSPCLSLCPTLSVSLPVCLTIQPVSPDPAGVRLFLRLPAEGAPPDQRAVPEEEGWIRGYAGAQITHMHTHVQLCTYHTHTWTLTFMWQRLLSWKQPGPTCIVLTWRITKVLRKPSSSNQA